MIAEIIILVVALLFLIISIFLFNGKGKCTMENAYMKQKGTYSIEDDQLTVTLETWSEPSTYTFSVDGNSLTMEENSGYGISGTFTKK